MLVIFVYNNKVKIMPKPSLWRGQKHQHFLKGNATCRLHRTTTKTSSMTNGRRSTPADQNDYITGHIWCLSTKTTCCLFLKSLVRGFSICRRCLQWVSYKYRALSRACQDLQQVYVYVCKTFEDAKRTNQKQKLWTDLGHVDVNKLFEKKRL
jgi:hypothetical protein